MGASSHRPDIIGHDKQKESRSLGSPCVSHWIGIDSYPNVTLHVMLRVYLKSPHE